MAWWLPGLSKPSVGVWRSQSVAGVRISHAVTHCMCHTQHRQPGAAVPLHILFAFTHGSLKEQKVKMQHHQLIFVAGWEIFLQLWVLQTFCKSSWVWNQDQWQHLGVGKSEQPFRVGNKSCHPAAVIDALMSVMGRQGLDQVDMRLSREKPSNRHLFPFLQACLQRQNL